MKFRSYVIVFTAVFTACFFMAGCLNESNKIPPNCYDGELNNGEEKIDCGGPKCDECPHCENGLWDADRGETWVDCGGECRVCPPCANGKKDQDEIGIDCGGVCGGCELLCGDNLLNGLESEVDCDTITGGCVACPTCDDGIFNGDEAGIDCGGLNSGCDPCCSTGNCGNGIKDGEEFFVDCGGNTCPNCDTLFSYNIESINYYAPKSVFTPPSYDDGTGILSYVLEDAYDADPEAPEVLLGSLSLNITRPPTGWVSNIGDALLVDLTEIPTVGDPALYSIVWTDALTGFTYSSALPGGRCLFKISHFDEISITNSDFANGCNKPVGFYRFFRGSFEGTLVAVNPLNPTTEVELTTGQFQFTFLP